MKVELARLQNLFAAEGEELGGQLGCPTGCSLDLPDALPDRLGLSGVELERAELGITADRGSGGC